MPELPEVETVRKSLERQVLGRRIKGIDVRDSRLREPVDVAALAARCRGRRIVALRRRSKYLLIDFEDGGVLLWHLGMSGRLRVQDRGEACEPHTHVILRLDDGRELRFRDPRRFGLVLADAAGGAGIARHLGHLGVEPLEPAFDAETLRRAARGSTRAIKNLIMDAGIVVGVGNIYASESLYRAGIRPGRAARRLTRGDCDRLAAAVKEVLADAVRQGGTTLNDFRSADGESGYFQVDLAVYGREGLACPACGAGIRRVVIGGRSSFYCPACQR